MGKMMNESDLPKRPFSELTISEQAAVLKARYDEETSERSSQRIKTRKQSAKSMVYPAAL